jgi:peptidoglycan/LPS O-acetylase OafA/YrhL
MSRIVSLQILRGFAATLVAGFHLYAAAIEEGFNPGLFWIFAGGEIGVDIFFVVSGFIIFYVVQSRPNMTWRDFIQARFWRILPPYWAILTLYILAAVAFAAFLGDSSKLPDRQTLLVSFLLLPYPDHVITIAWTLSVEILFYAIFALAYFSGGSRRIVIVMIVWVILSQVFTFVTDKPAWLLLPLHTAVLEFLFGILIAIRFLSSGPESPRLHLSALIFGGAGVGAYLASGGGHAGPFGREMVAGIPSALLVYGALGFALKGKSILEAWGDSSYILYLFHILYFSVVGKAINLMTGVNVYGSQVGLIAMLSTVVAISHLATVHLERPYQKWYKQFFSPHSKAET